MLFSHTMSLFSLLFLTVSFAIGKPLVWKPCEGTDYTKITIQNVTVDPYPVKAGLNATIEATIDFHEALDAGHWTMDIKYWSVVILHESGKVCDYCECPCKKTHDFDLILYAPSVSISGRYGGVFELFDNDDERQSCIDFEFDLRR